jgi:Fic family protein
VVEEPVRFSWTRWILWILLLVLFIILSLYYSIKYALYRSVYLIKKNAKGYKISLEELKTDIQDWLTKWVEGIRDWNDSLTGKTNQFFFRQHVDKGTFKATKYKIPKNLIPKTGDVAAVATSS